MTKNPADLAHHYVVRHAKGENITPATITAELVANGDTQAQAVSRTKTITALIPTVTQKSLNDYLRKVSA